MGTGSIAVIVVCVVVLGTLFAMRGSSALKGEVPKPAAGLVILALIVIAGLILFKATDKKAAPTEEEGEGAGMMMGQESAMGGALGGGMGGGRAPSPHRELATMVRKMAMFEATSEDAFSAEQAAKLMPILTSLQQAQSMTPEQAEARQAELETVMDEEQKTAVEAVELPRRGRGQAAPPEPQSTAAEAETTTPAETTEAAGGTAGEAPGGGSRGDWRARMRQRMLEVPYVKTKYDEKAAEDPDFATDEEKQGEFFRSLRSEMSPFLMGPAEEALKQLITDLSNET